MLTRLLETALIVSNTRSAESREHNVGGPASSVSCLLELSGFWLIIYSLVTSKSLLIVGPGKALFYAHGKVLADISPVMRVDVEGELRENRLETIELHAVGGDIDDETVGRSIEYAYQGDYTVPDPDSMERLTNSRDLEEALWTRDSSRGQ